MVQSPLCDSVRADTPRARVGRPVVEAEQVAWRAVPERGHEALLRPAQLRQHSHNNFQRIR